VKHGLDEVSFERKAFISFLKGRITRLYGKKATLKTFGSMATGLAITSSDLDLIVQDGSFKPRNRDTVL